MPCTGNNCTFALGTVHAKKFRRQVMLVGHPHGHNDVSQAQIGLRAKRFLHPELLQCHLAAALHFALVFSALLALDLIGTFRAAVFKLDFRAHRPSAAEIIAHVEHHVGEVKTAVALGIRLGRSIGVAQVTVAVEVPAHHRLAVTAKRQPLRPVCTTLAGSSGVGRLGGMNVQCARKAKKQGNRIT